MTSFYEAFTFFDESLSMNVLEKGQMSTFYGLIDQIDFVVFFMSDEKQLIDHVFGRSFQKMDQLDFVLQMELILYLQQIDEIYATYKQFMLFILILIGVFFTILMILLMRWTFIYFRHHIATQIHVNKNIISLIRTEFFEKNESIRSYLISNHLKDVIHKS